MESCLLIFFIMAGLVLYYKVASGHSKVPFIVALVITVPATIIIGRSSYESTKHRNDQAETNYSIHIYSAGL